MSICSEPRDAGQLLVTEASSSWYRQASHLNDQQTIARCPCQTCIRKWLPGKIPFLPLAKFTQPFIHSFVRSTSYRVPAMHLHSV